MHPALEHTWPQIQAELRRAVTDSTYHLWLAPLQARAIEGDALLVGAPEEIRTWVADCRHVSSRRKYEFHRPADNTLLARGTTDWVLLDAKTFAPLPIPQDIQNLYLPGNTGGA